MHLLSVENISKSYTDKALLDSISLSINEGDKIGLIGVNGTGKSTLLRIIAGVEKPDKGEVVKNSRVTLAYLSQEPQFDPDAPVLEQVFKGDPVMELIQEYNQAVANPNSSSESISRLSRQMDMMGAWNLETEARTILSKLDCRNFDAKMGTLSGGQKKRVALAGALAQPSDVLIMDEPTNHLDSEAIEWLEQYLIKRKGALLMITHDRYFLDRVVNQIIELDRGNLYSYRGTYTYFLQKKIEREEFESTREQKRRSLLKKELAWIRSGAKARTTKQKARIERFERLKGQKEAGPREKLEISVAGSRLGKKIIELEQVTKGYDNVTLINDFSLILKREDRIGIVGPNGSGKTTLLNLMSGNVGPDSGRVILGETVKTGLYSQELPIIDENLRVIEYVKEDTGYITTAEGEKISASQMLERFLFSPDLQWSPVKKLSGGEKRRLNLLKVLLEGPNVLLLDEPTNDLDVETLSILEDYLDNFAGSVIAVSHDRYFLDRMAQKIFAFECNGKIQQYPGNYSQYKKKKEKAVKDSQEAGGAGLAGSKTKKADVNPASNKTNTGLKTDHDRPLKLSYKEQKEYDEIEEVIHELEEKMENLQAEIEAAGSDYVLLERLCSEQAELEEELSEKMDRWVYLDELAEKTGKKPQKN